MTKKVIATTIDHGTNFVVYSIKQEIPKATYTIK